MKQFDEEACLRADPFEGDFGAPGDRILRNKIVDARKDGPCSTCDNGIKRGDRIRIMAAIFDGSMMYYRWCPVCCGEMATDAGAEID